MKRLKLAGLICWLCSPAWLFADGSLLEGMQSIRDVRLHRLESKIVDRPFFLLVKLPPGAQGCNSCQYPTVFLLDGGATFSTLAGYSVYLWHEQAVPEFILVGISYGADTFEEGNFRSTDYTAASEERDYWGGAGDFQRVLSSEIIPKITSSYPVDNERRIIFGQSLGGQFVLYTAMTRPSLFYGHIASNPALHRNLDFFLQPREVEGQTRLFVATGSNDAPRFRQPADQWMAHWTENDHPGFTLETRVLAGYGHFSILPESFRQGLDWLLED